MKKNKRYSIFSLARNARNYHENWAAAWRSPEPKPSYDAIIVGGGGHGLATAYYLAKQHGLNNIAVVEKGPIGLGNTGRNTTVIRSNYLWDESAAIYELSLKLYEGLSQELNYNIMLSQRGLISLAHNQHDMHEIERRVNAIRLNGIDSEMLSMADNKGFGHALWLRDSVRTVCQTLKIAGGWEFVIAATLSQIGYMTLPTDLAIRARERREISKEEQDVVASLPQISHKLLGKIPRLEGAARIILYQNKNYDGTGFPNDKVAGDDIPVGSRIIKILNDLAHLSTTEMSKYKLLNIMKERRGSYDTMLLEQIFSFIRTASRVCRGRRRKYRFRVAAGIAHRR